MSQQELRAPMGDDLTPSVPTGPQQPWGREGVQSGACQGALPWCTTATRPGLHPLTVMRPLAGNKGTGVITSSLHKHVKLRAIICGIQHRRQCLINVQGRHVLLLETPRPSSPQVTRALFPHIMVQRWAWCHGMILQRRGFDIKDAML